MAAIRVTAFGPHPEPGITPAVIRALWRLEGCLRMALGHKPVGLICCFGLGVGLLSACVAPGASRDRSAATPTPASRAGLPLRIYAPDTLLREPLLQAFQHRTGRAVERLSYLRPDHAAMAIREGKAMDLALLPGELVPGLAAEGLLRRLDGAGQLRGFAQVPLALRDLSVDPANRYSVPLAYGSIGLLLRLDRLAAVPARWADLWAPAYAGQLVVRDRARDLLGATLLAFGQEGDSEDPEALKQAAGQVLDLPAPGPRIVPLDLPASRALGAEAAAILLARAADYWEARAAGLDVAYVLPQEGGLLWSEHLVLPASGKAPEAALAFVSFLLEAEISARIARDGRVATAHQLAPRFLVPSLTEDRIVFPSPRSLAGSRFQWPRSPAGQVLYESLWPEVKTSLAQRGARP